MFRNVTIKLIFKFSLGYKGLHFKPVGSILHHDCFRCPQVGGDFQAFYHKPLTSINTNQKITFCTHIVECIVLLAMTTDILLCTTEMKLNAIVKLLKRRQWELLTKNHNINFAPEEIAKF